MGFAQRNKLHEEFETEVSQHLENGGWKTHSLVYHSNVDPQLAELLAEAQQVSPTAIYVTSRSDRIAIHPKHHRVFQFELKTHLPDSPPNMAIEALPLAFHSQVSRMGVRVMYICRNYKTGREYGFWCNAIPAIDRIMIPLRRWNATMIAYYRGVFELAFPGVKIVAWDAFGNGSGDPFALISPASLRAGTFDWKDEIRRLAENNP